MLQSNPLNFIDGETDPERAGACPRLHSEWRIESDEKSPWRWVGSFLEY